MLEKIKSSFKKCNSAKKIASQILYVSPADLNDINENKKNAIIRLSRVLETHLIIERYNAMPNKKAVNSLILQELIKENLVCIKESTQQLWKTNNLSLTFLDALSSEPRISFPCGSLKPESAIEGIGYAVVNTLKKHYPQLLTNKAALTVMCIRQFHPNSFFAKLPKDIVKIILQHTKTPTDYRKTPHRIRCF